MVDIDRRSIVTFAGAGLVLAACQPKSGKKHMTDMVGTCQLHGQSVTDKGPEVAGNVKSFLPDRICIVYLKFAANLMYARRTYIDISGTLPTDPAIQNTVLNELQRVSKWEPAIPSKDRDDIHPIRFGGQRLVVVYINNKQDYIRFAYNRGGTMQNEQESYTHLIRFTEYSGDDPINLSRIIRKNHAFFNIKKTTFPNISTEMESDTAFFLEYWDTDEYGDKIIVAQNDPDTHYIYSMNIKVEMAMSSPTGGSQRWVPVIVDPDTGNMGGDP